MTLIKSDLESLEVGGMETIADPRHGVEIETRSSHED